MEKKCFLCTIKHYAKPYKDRRRLSRNTARDATYLLVIIEKQKLIDMKVDIDRAKKLVFPHPTVCEVVREGLFEIK